MTFNSAVGTGAAGAAGAAGTPTLIQTVTASGSATLDFSNNLGAYTAWKVVGNVLIPGTANDNAWLRLGTGAGPTFATSAYDYAFSTKDTSGSAGGTQAAAAAQIVLTTNVAGAATIGFSFEATIVRNASTFAAVIWTGFTKGNGGTLWYNIGGAEWTMAASPLTGIRFMFSTGTVSTGTMSLYGITQ